MKKTDISGRDIPKTSGVYIFKRKNDILYIGKAVDLKSRINSYFSKNLTKERGVNICKMVENATDVEWIETQSGFEAVILEANLIKKYAPSYNTKEKSDKSFNFVLITNEEFPRILLVRGRDLKVKIKDNEIKYLFGPFAESSVIRKVLKIVRNIFPFRDKCSPNTGKPCFHASLGLCPGVCSGNVTKREYDKTIRNIRVLFEGKKEKLLVQMEKEMLLESKKHNFEKAAEKRDKISALRNIKEASLVEEFYKNQESGSGLGIKRMEGYDIAHISGASRVGVLVLFENGKEQKSGYRIFNIRTKKKGDTDALEEILKRRFKYKEWKTPDLLVIDGGVAQKKVAQKVLKEYGLENTIDIVSVVKDDKHKPRRILGKKKITELYKNTILKVNAEAHRFALSAHKKRRAKEFLV